MPVNMAYCRFQNTLEALRECEEALDEEGIGELSDAEQKAAKRLLKLCQSLTENYLSE